MIQEINFKGLSLTPDDHHTVPGELSLCANAELHNGALRPSVINATEITNKLKVGDDVATLLYVHKGTGYTHYVAVVGSVLHWFSENGSYDTNKGAIHAFTGLTIYQVTSVGNTLVVLTSNGVHYAKWRSNKYNYMGSHFPECNLSFGLQGRYYIMNGTFDVEMTGWYTYDPAYYADGTPCPDDNNLQGNSSITEQVLSQVNKFINEHADNGKFIFPFFVRYAYRLYDGTLVMHSAPVLMICDSGVTPFVFAKYYNESSGDYCSFTECAVGAGLFDLDYQLLNSSVKNDLKNNWDDIIQSVDIFVSKPLYKYDAAGQVRSVQRFRWNGSVDKDYCVCKVTPSIRGYEPEVVLPIGDFGNRYQRHDMRAFLNYGRTELNGYHFILPYKSDAKFSAEIRENSSFFFLASIKPENLPTSRTIIDLKKGYFGGIKEEEVDLGTIYTRELMTDDYDSHDTIIPKTAFVYNSRLNLANAIKRLYFGYNPGAQFAFTDGLILPDGFDPDTHYMIATDANDVVNGYIDHIEIYYFINQDGRDIIVKGPEFEFGHDTPLPFIYSPSPKAYQAVIHRYVGYTELTAIENNYYLVPLDPHALLNGTVFFDKFTTETPGSLTTKPSVSDNADIPITNKLYTSEVDNPFYFPLENIQTVGLGTILGFSNITKALSPGQRGKFSLLVFSTDGVWALEISSTGTLLPPNIISNDVCINPGSICQLSQRVLFATKRGIFQIVSEDSASISSILDGPVFKASELPHLVTQLQAKDDDGHLLYNYTYTTADTPPVTVVFTVYQGDSGWIDVDTDEPVTPPEGITPTITPLIDEAYSDLYSLMNLSEHPFDFFADAKLLYDFANARVLIIKDDAATPQALVYSLTDGAWSTMYAGEILSAVSGTPYPYAQKPDGTLLLLDNNYNYADASRVNSLVITRSLSYSSTMQVIQSFQQIEDSPKANTPLLVLYGSNDNVHWNYIGRSQRRHSPYLPGHPYRYFRAAIFGQMAPGENYSKLLLDVIEKYQKL